jgi:Fe-S cluster biogenesis protein NfuA
MSEISIKIEPTSSDNIKKFVTNTFLTQATSYEFGNIDESQKSPIAQKLFHFPFVKTVYISQNFIAIEKFNIAPWEEIEEQLKETLLAYLNSGQPVISESKSTLPVTVYAESTPNPDVMKFVANRVLINGMFEFKTPDEATKAPIASVLFNLPFVKEVFVNNNYISITKNKAISWDEIVLEVRDFIKNYIADGNPLFSDTLLQEHTDQESTTIQEKTPETPIEEEIVAILNEFVKPAVTQDGGNIAFQDYDTNSKTVRVILQGACSGCPSSTVTLKNGIETMLKQMLPEDVKTVEAING